MSTRLPGKKYKSVFDRGRPLRGRLMTAWVLRSEDAGRQAGVVVSKKSFHDAVDDADWVLVGRASLGGRRTADVMRELRYLATKCGR